MNKFLVNTTDSVGFIYTSDWHLSERPPGRRTASYARDVMDKIKFAGKLAEERDAIMLCGGDIFHIKDPRSPSNGYGLVNPLISLLSDMPYGVVFGAHGNHDLFADRVESLSTQPLGALLAAKVYRDLSAEPCIFSSKNHTVHVSVEAYPYADDMVTLERVLNAPERPKVDGEPVQYRVAILHQYGHPGGQGSMFGHPTIGYDQLAECDYDLILWGHDHSREKTVTVGNATHIRMGSLARAALSSDEVDRPVVAVSLTFKKDALVYKEIPIPVKPLEVAFVAADKVMEKVDSSAEVTNFFHVMDASVAEMETTDTKEVVDVLCADDVTVRDKVYDLCQL